MAFQAYTVRKFLDIFGYFSRSKSVKQKKVFFYPFAQIRFGEYIELQKETCVLLEALTYEPIGFPLML